MGWIGRNALAVLLLGCGAGSLHAQDLRYWHFERDTRERVTTGRQ